jgi:Ca2+-transporting ATPase
VVALLLAAVAISLLLGDQLDALAVTLIDFVTELRARHAMESIRQLQVPRTAVVRGGHLRVIPAEELVPGDVLELHPGRHVAADARQARKLWRTRRP